jgi:hypothetical protein
MPNIEVNYEDAKKEVAQYIARQEGCTFPSTRHFNRAAKILWPALSAAAQSKLVLR